MTTKTDLRPDHPALKNKRTIFLKSIQAPQKASSILKSAKTNAKLGNRKSKIMRGRWRGMELYQLLLEERATCPKTCQQWSSCYGNNMFLAKRIDHTSKKFFPLLERELEELAEKHPGGFVVRLHVLGDFYSKTYVRFWLRMMARHPELKIFGYTHRWPEHKDGIGKEVEKLNAAGAFIRFSDRGGDMSANVGVSVRGDEIQCPQEIGLTESCLTCGLCWQTPKPIKFIEH
jgi:hypothetical protein